MRVERRSCAGLEDGPGIGIAEELPPKEFRRGDGTGAQDAVEAGGRRGEICTVISILASCGSSSESSSLCGDFARAEGTIFSSAKPTLRPSRLSLFPASIHLWTSGVSRPKTPRCLSGALPFAARDGGNGVMGTLPVEGRSGLGVLSLDTGHCTLVRGSASPNAIGSGGTGGIGDMLSAAHSFEPFRVAGADLATVEADVEDLAGRAVAVREMEDEPLTLVPRVDPVIAREDVDL